MSQREEGRRRRIKRSGEERVGVVVVGKENPRYNILLACIKFLLWALNPCVGGIALIHSLGPVGTREEGLSPGIFQSLLFSRLRRMRKEGNFPLIPTRLPTSQ